MHVLLLEVLLLHILIHELHLLPLVVVVQVEDVRHAVLACAPTPDSGIARYTLSRVGREIDGVCESLPLLLLTMLMLIHVLLHMLLLLLLLRDVRHTDQPRAPYPDPGVTN